MVELRDPALASSGDDVHGFSADRRLELVARLPGTQALFIRKDGRLRTA